MKVLPVVSGGLDSVVMVCDYHARNWEIPAIVSFNYGQRHNKELRCAQAIAGQLGAEWVLVDLTTVGKLLGGSALTDKIDVPDGHYAEDSMRITVVPNRNMIMLAIAAGVATARGINHISTAVHAGDHFVYPDCRPEFMQATGLALYEGTKGFGDIQLHTPFIEITKADIVGIGASNGTPFANTWSCYKGQVNHCGRCGTCVERKEAFRLAGVVDPTLYEDADYEIAAYRG